MLRLPTGQVPDSVYESSDSPLPLLSASVKDSVSESSFLWSDTLLLSRPTAVYNMACDTYLYTQREAVSKYTLDANAVEYYSEQIFFLKSKHLFTVLPSLPAAGKFYEGSHRKNRWCLFLKMSSEATWGAIFLRKIQHMPPHTTGNTPSDIQVLRNVSLAHRHWTPDRQLWVCIASEVISPVKIVKLLSYYISSGVGTVSTSNIVNNTNKRKYLHIHPLKIFFLVYER